MLLDGGRCSDGWRLFLLLGERQCGEGEGKEEEWSGGGKVEGGMDGWMEDVEEIIKKVEGGGGLEGG